MHLSASNIFHHKISILSLKPVNTTSLLGHPIVGELEEHLRQAGYNVVKVSTLRSFTRRTLRAYVKELPDSIALIVDGLFLFDFGEKHRRVIEDSIKVKDIYVYILTSIPPQLLKELDVLYNVLYTEYAGNETAEMVQYIGAGMKIGEEMLHVLEPFMRRKPVHVLILAGLYQVATDLGRELSKRYGYELVVVNKPVDGFELKENMVVAGVFYPVSLLHRGNLIILAKERPKQIEVLEILFRAKRFSVPVVSLYQVFRVATGAVEREVATKRRSSGDVMEYTARGAEKVMVSANGRIAIRPVTIASAESTKSIRGQQVSLKPSVNDVVKRYLLSGGTANQSIIDGLDETLRRHGYVLPWNQVINITLNTIEELLNTTTSYITLEKLFKALTELGRLDTYRSRAEELIWKLVDKYSRIGPSVYFLLDCENHTARYVSNTDSLVYSYLLQFVKRDLDKLCQERVKTYHGIRVEYSDELMKKLNEYVLKNADKIERCIIKVVNKARGVCGVPDEIKHICSVPMKIKVTQVDVNDHSVILNLIATIRREIVIMVPISIPIGTLHQLVSTPKRHIDLIPEIKKIGEEVLDKIAKSLRKSHDSINNTSLLGSSTKR